MKLSLTKKEIIALLDDLYKIKYDDKYGNKTYNRKTFKNGYEFDKSYSNAIVKLRRAIKFKEDKDD